MNAIPMKKAIPIILTKTKVIKSTTNRGDSAKTYVHVYRHGIDKDEKTVVISKFVLYKIREGESLPNFYQVRRIWKKDYVLLFHKTSFKQSTLNEINDFVNL